MKKLTAGIFATLLTVVTVGAANAEIASKTYVDDQVGTRATTESVTILSGTVTSQGQRLTTAEGDIDTLQANSATKTELTEGLAGKQDSALIKSAQYGDNTGNDDAYPSVKAVADAITTVSGNVTGVTEDITELQGTVADLEANKADKATTLQGYNITDAYTKTEVDTALEAKANTADLGALAAKDTVSAAEIDANAVTTAKIADGNVTKAKLATDVQASLDKADGALQQADLADYAKTADVANTYETKANATATYETKTNAAATYATKDQIANMATTTDLANKQDKTDNTLATTTKTVVGAINEVNTAVGAAQGAAEAAQTTADEAKNTALAAIPKPTDPSCENPTNKCVLTYNNSAYEWEVVAR